MTALKYLLPPACAVFLLSSPRAAEAGPDHPLPALSVEQQRAVGVVVARAPRAIAPKRLDAYGQVLDPSRLVADAGRLDAARALAKAAVAETARLKGLYRGANASLKAVQRAEAAQTEARVRVQQARTRFLLRWGPLARLAAAQRARLIEHLADATQLLLRADLPGRHSLGAIPTHALIDVDGLKVPARVLGVLPRAGAQVQGVGLLLQIPRPPGGLGPGAQLPVTLEDGDRDGRVVPDGALLYGKQGVYVYRELPEKAKDGDTRFTPLRVTLLQPIGSGWLVSGLHAGDRIVVRGAGVLWSLQGLRTFAGND